MPPTADRFRFELHSLLNEAERMGFVAVEVRASALHRRVGEYPGPDHNIGGCCEVMLAEMGAMDSVLSDPEKNKGANLVIRYALPRAHVTANVS